ncbi:MAG: ferrochelatase [Nitrospiraceae bacterium]|nr:ferrochelatase [Nitrospiraceae bacterium]
MSDDTDKTIGVFLLNLGGPDSLEAVRPFLYNLFSDREIIRLGPSFMQKPLAYLISSLRHKKTEGYYRQIGGRSPILEITTAQARALEESLNGGEEGTAHASFRVFVGMRYWRPFIEDVVPAIVHEGIRRVIAIGLYPQYSVATTGSSVSRLREAAAGLPLELHTVLSWHDHPLYIDALMERIRKGLGLFADRASEVHVLFSAHSLPKKFIDEGDPYADHINATIAGVVRRMDIPWSLAYQSRSGPVEWLEPSTERMIAGLASKGVRNLLVVPISFVSDHIETLYEIDIVYKSMAKRLGMRLERVESMNTFPLFIAALGDIVTRGIKEAGWGE